MISILIISYNTAQMTVDCIRSVFEQTKLSQFEVIVLDNASSDDSVSRIKVEFGDQVKLIDSKINFGFAQGNNIAAQSATGDYLLLLNPDTVVLNGAIDKLLQFATAKPDFKIWGGKTLFGDLSLNPGSCWSKQSVWGLLCQALGLNSIFRNSGFFNPEGMGGWDRGCDRNVDIVCGCFLMIKRAFWTQLGGFRKEFFMYGEEADLCLRAQNLGAIPAVTSNAVIIHYGGASEKIRADKLVRLLTAKMLLIEYHFPRYLRPLGKFLLYLWPASRFFAHKLLSYFNPRFIESAASWQNVMKNSKEWYA